MQYGRLPLGVGLSPRTDVWQPSIVNRNMDGTAVDLDDIYQFEYQIASLKCFEQVLLVNASMNFYCLSLTSITLTIPALASNVSRKLQSPLQSDD